MPLIFLRDLIERGFCGSYSTTLPSPTMGLLQWSLDMIIYESTKGTCPGVRDPLQLCNQYGARFEDQQFFIERVNGVYRRISLFNREDLTIEPKSAKIDDSSVEFVLFRDKATGIFTEPVYDFYSPDYHVPIYSIMCAYLMDMVGPINVDCVSIIGDTLSSNGWYINRHQCKELLDGIISGSIVPGRQCASCATTHCSMATTFESLVLDWMKQKQLSGAMEQKIRDHLTYNGPTKCGSHLVYMRESKRRTLSQKDDEALVSDLVATVTDFKEYLKPDAPAIAKAISAGELDPRFLKRFKEHSSFSIDTTFCL